MGELKTSISGKRAFRPSSNTDWPVSDVSIDLTVEVGGATLALHRFLLVSKSGRIRKLLQETKDSKITRVHLPALFPGGMEAFELAAKFCYGVDVDITPANVAMLKCAAHYLEMTEEFADKNLEARAEAYLRAAVLGDIAACIHVLHRCEALMPTAEETHLVGRLIAAIANNACKEQLTSGLSRLERDFSGKPRPEAEVEPPADWWGKALAALHLDFFQRVMSTMKTKGLGQGLICGILIDYAQHSLQGVIARDPPAAELQRKQRLIVEAIVSLLPTPSRKSAVPMAFLSSLLRHAVAASASAPCRSDLERRMGLQLDQAILEDILVPSSPRGGDGGPLYDTDPISRIFAVFLNLDEDDDEDNPLRHETEAGYDPDSPGSPKQSAILKVSKLLDSYLAEIALDPNLPPSKFTSLAELLPDHARLVNDGLYRAVDIFLEAHPNSKESERHRLCKAIDCQKLSQEACSHAAQNERLPVQMAVQVLYFEQIRLRNAMNGGGGLHTQLLFGSTNGQFPQRSGSGAGSGAISPRDNYAAVRRENRELKLEVARMRMRLTELEKNHVSMKQELGRPHPANKMLKSLARKLGKINAIFKVRDLRPAGSRANSESRFLFQKRWRHSVS